MSARNPVILQNCRVFDGSEVQDGQSLRFEAGILTDVGPAEQIPRNADVLDLNGDILSPGYVDLQVNGGGGVMLNDAPSLGGLRRIAQAHRQLGVTHLLPTLITDTPEITRAAISATQEAIAARISGIAGLHLEGPHLSIARKGAHDASLIRPMTHDDLAMLLDAARALPVLKVTIAPENVTEDQVSTLADAGVLVSLGHTDADFETCQRYFAAGARCVTHLFNAMSQLGSRAPGLVGAALSNGAISAGLIADGIHVHTDTMGLAWRAKQAPGALFLISDAMAVAGTSEDSFMLNGRKVLRRDKQLRLEDGTLAGAYLGLTTAVSVLTNEVGVGLNAALAGATVVPARLIGLPSPVLSRGTTRLSDLIRIKADLSTACPLDAIVA